MKKMKKIAKKVVRDCLQIKESKNVIIDAYMVKEEQIDFISDIALEVRKKGATPVVVARPERYILNTLKEVPIQYLDACPNHLLALYRESNARIGVTVRSGADFSQITPERWKAYKKIDQKFENLLSKSQLKSINLYLPSKELASKLGWDYKDLFHMFIDALDIDYNKLREESEKLRKILSEGKEVHIFSKKGTNLTFSRHFGIIQEY